MTSGQVVRRATEESGLERFRRSHAVSIPVAVAVVAVAALIMGSGDPLAAAVAVVVGGGAGVAAWRWADPVVAVPLRWATVARDTGLVAAGSGVPNLRRVWAGPAGPTFVVGCGGLAAGSVEDAAARIAAGFGFAWCEVEETTNYRAVIRLHRRGAKGVRAAWT